MSFHKKLSAPLLLAALASPALINCGVLGNIPGAGCPAMKDGNISGLKLEGNADVQGKVKGFLQAVYDYDKVAIGVEQDMMDSCAEIGKAMGMSAAELEAEPGGGDGAKKVCSGVQAKMDAVFNASAGVSLEISIGAPYCEVPIDAMNECLEGCGAVIDAGKLEASCQEGEVSGSCEADCTGSCTVQASPNCNGSCNGDCKGKCEGKNSDGYCDGKCEGNCSASCKMEGQAKCEGSCSGGCSAELKAPSCTGTYEPPSVSADCHAGCVTKTAKDVKCYPPSAKIDVKGEATAEITNLVKGLKVALPKIKTIQVGSAKRLANAGKTLVKTGSELPTVAKNAGLQAVACVGTAANMAVSAQASVNVSVEFSASVSAGASGSASAGAGN